MAEVDFNERARIALAPEGTALPVPFFGTMPQRQIGPAFKAQTVAIKLQNSKDAIAAALDVEASHGTPFLFVPVFMGSGAAAYFLHPSEPAMIPLLSVVVLLFLGWRYRLSLGKRAWIASAMLCIACGVLLAKAETLRVQSVMLGGGVTATIDMQVLRVDRDGKRLRVLGRVLATRAPELKFQPTRVRISMPSSKYDFSAGDIISGRFGLRPPGGPVRPGSYDFAFHAYFAGVGASGFPMGTISRLEGLEPAGMGAIRYKLENLRAGVADKVRSVIPGTSGNVAAALIAGVTGGIDEANEEALRVTGLAHVLSISGLHMALVAGAVLFLVRIGFAFFPAFAARYPIKKWAAGAALAASFFYLLMSGGAVATVRSFLMLAVMLGAVMLDRQALTLRNLAIAAILILVVTPHEIMGPSFQMSFAATAALISAYGWISRRRENKFAQQANNGHWQTIRTVVLGAVLTPVVAGLATAIFSAWHFHRLAPMGLPANLGAMPVISFVIMPFAMLGTAAMPFGLEEWPLKIMGYGVDAMLWIARWCASHSPQDTTGALAPAAFVLLILTLLILTLCQSRIRIAALALVPLAALSALQDKTPDLWISEDARLVAISTVDGALAVNRERPNAFTTQVWRNAAAAKIVAKPKMTKERETTNSSAGVLAPEAGDTAAESGSADAFTGTQTSEVSVTSLAKAAKTSPDRFLCAQGACVAWVAGKAMVAWLDPAAFTSSGQQPNSSNNDNSSPAKVDTGNPAQADAGAMDEAGVLEAGVLEAGVLEAGVLEAGVLARQIAKLFFQACNATDLVITASAIPFRGCGNGKAHLIRASDLARKGAVEIRFAYPGTYAQSASAPAKSKTNEKTLAGSQESNSIVPETIESNEMDTRESSTKTSDSAITSNRKNASGFHPQDNPVEITIRHANGEPNRPWNRERIYSRAARNIPEFQNSKGRNKPNTNSIKPKPEPAAAAHAETANTPPDGDTPEE